MKNLWAILFIIYNIGFAQIEQDKVYHFAAGVTSSAVGYSFVYEKTNDKLLASAAGLGLSILAGVAKETYDSTRPNNKFDTEDLKATALGGLTVTITINIDNLFNKMKKRKLNSTNPKYYPISEKNLTKERKELIASIDKGMHRKKKKIVNVYAVFSELE